MQVCGNCYYAKREVNDDGSVTYFADDTRHDRLTLWEKRTLFNMEKYMVWIGVVSTKKVMLITRRS